MKKNTTSESGIVLLEAVVAVGVIIMIVSAVLQLMVSSTSATRIASDRVVATYLAQDAAEWLLARSKYNQRQSTNWLTGIDGVVCSPNCVLDTSEDIDAVHTPLVSCATPTPSCTLHRFNLAPRIYTHVGTLTIPTDYARFIKVTTDDLDGDGADDTATYTITVSWSDDSLSLVIHLYDE